MKYEKKTPRNKAIQKMYSEFMELTLEQQKDKLVELTDLKGDSELAIKALSDAIYSKQNPIRVKPKRRKI